MIARFEALFSGEGYSFQVEIEPNLTAQVDGRRIEQVLYNLIGNAMHYAGADRLVLVRAKGLKGAVRVEIVDHGEGIPEEELPMIWERYYKARHARAKAGTGLGLSIVKHIASSMNGNVTVSSAPGRGSVFTVVLPVS